MPTANPGEHDAMEGSSRDHADSAQTESKVQCAVYFFCRRGEFKLVFSLQDLGVFRKLHRKKLSPNMLRPRAPSEKERVADRVKSVSERFMNAFERTLDEALRDSVISSCCSVSAEISLKIHPDVHVVVHIL